MNDPNFATNLRRLLSFEHRTGKEAAEALGVNQATISRWLTGRRYPSYEALIAIDRLYGVSPRELDGDPVDFAQRLADPARMKHAEQARQHKATKGELTAADAAAMSKKAAKEKQAALDALKVVELRPRATK